MSIQHKFEMSCCLEHQNPLDGKIVRMIWNDHYRAITRRAVGRQEGRFPRNRFGSPQGALQDRSRIVPIREVIHHASSLKVEVCFHRAESTKT